MQGHRVEVLEGDSSPHPLVHRFPAQSPKVTRHCTASYKSNRLPLAVFYSPQLTGANLAKQVVSAQLWRTAVLGLCLLCPAPTSPHLCGPQHACPLKLDTLMCKMSKQDCKVFIGGLSWETTGEKLRAYFENYGTVREAFVSYNRNNGRPRGFGFVVFENPEVADKVVAAKHTIDRREVRPATLPLAAPRWPCA